MPKVKAPVRSTKYCLDCGYPLDGLPEQRCPECGRKFDIKEPCTYSTSVLPTTRASWMARGYLIVSCTGVGLIGLTAFTALRDRGFRTVPAIICLIGYLMEIAVIIAGLVALIRGLDREERRAGGFDPAMWVAGVTLALSLRVVVHALFAVF